AGGSAGLLVGWGHGCWGFCFADVQGAVRLDPSRIAAQIVSGIGFLGTGMIILQKRVISGLTTAAGLWAAAGIGMAIGGGVYVVGIAATLLTLVGLEVLRWRADRWIDVENVRISCTVKEPAELHRILERLRADKIRVLHCSRKTVGDVVCAHFLVRCNMRAAGNEKLLRIFQETDGFRMQKQD
ncbi:MAG: MgtC/SapB family protein, partial [Victivallaceae bacterium]|nr:MgtC/SapB family protein [Victivallaceae bacterium]